MSNSSNDQNQFKDVLQAIEENTERSPEKTSADAGYFSAANIQAAQTYQTDAYIAAGKEGKQAQNSYDKTNFSYDPRTDTYTCPMGKTLEKVKTQNENTPDKATKWIYECQACPGRPFTPKSPLFLNH